MRISDWSSDVCSSDLADVMRAGGGAIAGRRRKRKFELAWQPVEFRMERRPLPGDLAIRTWIYKLIVRDAGEMIRGHIANAIAGCLDRMHLHGRQLGEDVRHLFELGPVELHVLSRREMTEALVVDRKSTRLNSSH